MTPLPGHFTDFQEFTFRFWGGLGPASLGQPPGYDSIDRRVENQAGVSAGHFKIGAGVFVDANPPVHNPVGAGVNSGLGDYGLGNRLVQGPGSLTLAMAGETMRLFLPPSLQPDPFADPAARL